MRIASSTSVTKTLPSPIFPVLADCKIAYHALGAIVIHHYFKFHLRQKIHRVFAAAIDFAVAFLPAETTNFAQRHPFNSHSGKRVFHRFRFKWFDDRLNFFHRAQTRTHIAKRKQMAFSAAAHFTCAE